MTAGRQPKIDYAVEFVTDEDGGLMGHMKNPREFVPIATIANLVAVPASRALTSADYEQELSCASGVAITIPTDATLGITDATFAPTIALYCAGAIPFTLVTMGLTMRGTAPTIAQYGFYGIKRVGANEWAYL